MEQIRQWFVLLLFICWKQREDDEENTEIEPRACKEPVQKQVYIKLIMYVNSKSVKINLCVVRPGYVKFRSGHACQLHKHSMFSTE